MGTPFCTCSFVSAENNPGIWKQPVKSPGSGWSGRDSLSLGKQGAKTSLNLFPFLSTFVILFQIQSVRSRLKHYVASSLIGNCGKYLATIVTSLYSRVDFIFENSIKSSRSKPGKSDWAKMARCRSY